MREAQRREETVRLHAQCDADRDKAVTEQEHEMNALDAKQTETWNQFQTAERAGENARACVALWTCAYTLRSGKRKTSIQICKNADLHERLRQDAG